MLVHGPGDVQGQPIELDDEQTRFVLRAYEIDDRGKRLVRRAVFSRPKGRAKSELASMLACAEALGPVRFNGWDHDGRPLGCPVGSPLVRIAATEEGQAGDTYEAAQFMLNEGRVSTLEGLDVGLTRTFIPGGGKIVPVTASAASKEGGRETFAIFDETHLYTTAELHRLHQTIRRNLAKRKSAEPWSLEVTTMYGIGEDSVAESSYKYAEAVREGRITDPGFLFDHREAPSGFDFEDGDELRAALAYVYGAAAEWMDLDRLVAEARDPQTEEALFRRFFLNQATVRTDAFLPAGVWDKLAQPDKQVPERAEIVLGFDGSVGGAHGLDSTALVAVTVEDVPHVFTVACWERPPGAKEWLVPRHEVDVEVERAHERWRVREHVCDRSRWYDEYQEWTARYGSPPLVEFPQSRPGMSLASTAFRNAVLRGELTHDGDPRLARHLGNAVATPRGRDGFFINKDSKHSTRTIDLATASVMAHLRAIAPDLSRSRSVYAERGIVVV